MRKEELKGLKRINATPKMMKLAKENKLIKPRIYKEGWSIKELSTRYDMFVRCQTRGRILMVALFFPEMMQKGIIEPLYEIYINPEGNEWITRIKDFGQLEKWSTSKLVNLGLVFHDTYLSGYELSCREASSRIWQSPEGKRTIRDFLETDSNGCYGIIEWQEKARDIKIKEREERQQKPWDEDMALVPEVMPGFIRWSEHDAHNQNYIFYDYDKKGATSGYCSYCEKTVPISKPKRNEDAKCPCCGKKITYKIASQIQTLSRKEWFTECIQRIKGGCVIRVYRNQSWWRDRAPDNPHRIMQEEDRYLMMDNGRHIRYEWACYKNKYMRWVKSDRPFTENYMGNKVKLYRKNMSSLKKTVLKDSAYDVWPKLPCNVAKYLWIERHNPVVEKLAKVKMFTLAADIMKERYDAGLINQEATELVKSLKIDKARLRRLRDMNGGVMALRWMQFEKLADTVWPDNMIRDFGAAEIGTGGFNFITTQKPHFVRCWNYLNKQSKLSGDSVFRTLHTWNDYYNMAEKAKWNTSAEQIIYPKNLHEAHQKVILCLQGEDMKKQARKLEEKWPKVNEILPSIKKFEWGNEEYKIVTPDSVLDIVVEGTALNHCVHTCDFYFDRIQKNESYLFFLRKADTPDTPWYTLEVEPSGNIRQKRTTGDNQNKDFEMAVPFLKKWQKVFKSRLTKEEKELGVLADKARIKEYKKLRKDGNKIWHGKLAGKLLVDVLEADFMEA